MRRRPIARALLYQGATNLERALDQALLGLDPDRVKRLVLFTDGNQTAGRRLAGAAAPAGAGRARVSHFAATPQTRDRRLDRSMELPDDVRRDEPITVTVRVFSQQRTRARVRLSAAGQRARCAAMSRSSPERTASCFRCGCVSAGAVTLSAQVQARGRCAAGQRSAGAGGLGRPAAARALCRGAAASAQYLRDALDREGLDVTVAGAGWRAASGAVLDLFDAVILSDVPRKAWMPRACRRCESYVRSTAAD